MHPARQIVRSLVEVRLSALHEDQWAFGTIGEPKPRSDFSSRVSNFIKSNKAQDVLHSAASKVISGVQHHHKAILAGAVTTGLTHALHIDPWPGDLEEQVHHHIEHLGTSLSITKTMAHSMLKDTVGKLRAVRGLKEHDKDYEKDDELDKALNRLHHILKKIEPHYNPKPSDKEPEKKDSK